MTAMMGNAAVSGAGERLPMQQKVTASVQMMTLPRGAYAVIHGGTVRPTQAINGQAFPCVQVSPLPGQPAELLQSATAAGWLSQDGDIAVIKVVGETAAIMVTTYTPEGYGETGLRIEVKRLAAEGATAAVAEAARVAPTPAAPQPQPQAPAAAPVQAPAPVADSEPSLVLHIQNYGDRTFPAGQWAGPRGQRLRIEGFKVVLPPGMPADALEYRAMAPGDKMTPWIASGTYCGSKGRGIPMTGLAIRVRGDLAQRYDVLYQASFFSGAQSETCRDGAACRSPQDNDPVDALRIKVVERG